MPHLASPGSVSLADFRDWKDRFQGYIRVQKIQQECDLEARRDIVRLGLDREWTKLWSSGVLPVAAQDDVDQILTHISTYLRRLRNPHLFFCKKPRHFAICLNFLIAYDIYMVYNKSNADLFF